MNDHFKYPGDELELFQHANRWKKYFSGKIKYFIKGQVLEAGAGIGATTLLLNDGSATNWLLLEPDPAMSGQLQEKLKNHELPVNCRIKTGTTSDLSEKFDTILYIDVLEHIEDDKAELQRAAGLLNPGGHIIVLSPAFPWLYSPFDKAIGHYRRYTKKMLRMAAPPELQIVNNCYYDTVGFFTSVANKLLLRQRYPTEKQVLFWDRWMVPVSKLTDNIFFHAFGKSIIATWKK